MKAPDVTIDISLVHDLPLFRQMEAADLGRLMARERKAEYPQLLFDA